jgi:ABC-type glycerol-3-phosphate transport system permease component
MAGAVVASVSVIILFIAVQRQIVESVARSGLKG